MTVNDLSYLSSPVTELFASSHSETQSRLSDADVGAFHELGFCAGIRVLTDEQVEQLRLELEPLLNPEHPGRELFHEFHANESENPGQEVMHALGAWRIAPAFHDLIWNLAITVPASQLLGGAVRFWHDQLFVKPGTRGGSVAWHQDYSYWTRTQPMAHLTCWIPLDDVDEGSGTVLYVPKSHLWDHLPITGLTGNMDAIHEVLTTAQLEAFTPVPMTLRKGEASFHHPLTIHGSPPNTSERPRRAIALNFCLDGTKSNTNEPLLKGIPVIPKGEPLQGRFFPLLYVPLNR